MDIIKFSFNVAWTIKNYCNGITSLNHFDLCQRLTGSLRFGCNNWIVLVGSDGDIIRQPIMDLNNIVQFEPVECSDISIVVCDLHMRDIVGIAGRRSDPVKHC